MGFSSYPRGHYYGQSQSQVRPVPTYPAPPLGQLVEKVNRDDLSSKPSENSERVGISGTTTVASFNWVDASHPKIMIPGKPPRWTPPKNPRKLAWDSGDYYRDRNAASYPKHPLEATILSTMEMHPNPLSVDIVACGSTLGNLLRFASGVDKDRPFRMLVEKIGRVVHLVRRENSPRQLIPDVKGFGHTFPEAYTTWDSDVKGSISHQRIIKYELGGIGLLVRFEADGFIGQAAKPPLRRGPASGDALSLIEKMGLGATPLLPEDAEAEIEITSTGSKVPHSSVFDLKTRSVRVRDRDTLGEQIPRLWVSQISKFILAYHERGAFNEIEVKDVADKVKEWENENQGSLQRLVSLLHLVIGRASTARDGKLEIVWSCEGSLEIREQVSDAADTLSDNIKFEWLVWQSAGGSNKDDPVKALDPDSDSGSPDAQNYKRLSGSTDSYGAPGSSWSFEDATDNESYDYAACDKECGYCGKCDY